MIFTATSNSNLSPLSRILHHLENRKSGGTTKNEARREVERSIRFFYCVNGHNHITAERSLNRKVIKHVISDHKKITTPVLCSWLVVVGGGGGGSWATNNKKREERRRAKGVRFSSFFVLPQCFIMRDPVAGRTVK